MFNQSTAVQKPSGNSGNKQKQDFGPCEPGQDAGRIVRLTGFGVQKDKGMPNNKFNNYVDKNGNPDPVTVIQVTIELPNQRISYEDKDGNKQERPRWVWSQDIPIKFFQDFDTGEFRASEKSKIHELMSAVFPKEGSVWTLKKVQEFLPKIIGEPVGVFITNYVSKSGNEGDNIKNFLPVMRGVVLPELENETLYYDPYNHDEEVFQKLHERTQRRIQNRLDKDSGVEPNTSEQSSQAKPSKQPEPHPQQEDDNDLPF